MPVIDLGRVIGPQGPQGDTGAQGIRGEQGLPGPNQVTNSTATPLTGVLTGNGSVVGVESIDAAPTADSTGFATSGGTYKAIKGRVPVYGKGKNLLRNWYFVGGGTGRGVFPVNQRGQTSYTAAAYTIDGWKIPGGANRISVDLRSDCIRIIRGTAASGSGIRMTLSQTYSGVLTISALVSSHISAASGSLTVLMRDANNSILVRTSTRITTLTGGELLTATYSGNGNPVKQVDFVMSDSAAQNDYADLYAVKLEPGTEQSLAHLENGIWVLNDIPDYEYELYRCQTSTADPTDTYANKTLATGQELAYVENGTTASRAYAIGEYFCWHGSLYLAKTAIGNGDTFTENTNCEVVTGGGINDLFGKKATVLFGTTGASSETLAVSAGRFLIILATRGDTSFTFAVVYRCNSWKLEGTNTAGVTVDANTGQITLLNYTHYKIIY